MSSQEQQSSFAEQVTDAVGTLASYVKVPVLASSAIAVVLSGALYFKQK